MQRLEFYKSPDVDLVVAPWGFGGTDNLAQEGAHSFIEKDIIKKLESVGSKVNLLDPPSLGPFQVQEGPGRIRNIEAINQVNFWLSGRVEQSFREGHIPIVLGGDGSLSIASVAGIARTLASKEDLGVLWINNHLCNSSPEVTKSWNANRMAFTAISYSDDLNKLHHDFKSLIETVVGGNVPILSKENIVHVGVSLKSAQEKAHHPYFTMEHVEDMGLKQVLEAALAILEKCRHIHIILDVNSLNLSGVSNRSIGQLSYREALSIARAIDVKVRRINKLSSIDIVEHCPSREAWDKRGETAEWMTNVVANIFGENIFNALRQY